MQHHTASFLLFLTSRIPHLRQEYSAVVSWSEFPYVSAIKRGDAEEIRKTVAP